MERLEFMWQAAPKVATTAVAGPIGREIPGEETQKGKDTNFSPWVPDEAMREALRTGGEFVPYTQRSSKSEVHRHFSQNTSEALQGLIDLPLSAENALPDNSHGTLGESSSPNTKKRKMHHAVTVRTRNHSVVPLNMQDPQPAPASLIELSTHPVPNSNVVERFGPDEFRCFFMHDLHNGCLHRQGLRESYLGQKNKTG